MTQTINAQLSNQLHRIQGQLKGVERMMQNSRGCSEIIMQLMAARSSIECLTVRLIQSEAKVCVRSKSKTEQLKLEKLAATLFKYT